MAAGRPAGRSAQPSLWMGELTLACAFAAMVILALSAMPQATALSGRALSSTRTNPPVEILQAPHKSASLLALAARRSSGETRASTRPASGRADPRDVRPTGVLAIAPGRSAPSGNGVVWRFSVEVERGIPIDRDVFAKRVEATLYDARGWGSSKTISFQRTDRGPVAFRVTLATPQTTDSLCAPLDTNGVFSCHQGDRAVLNYWRWVRGANAYGERLASYRTYMINHEVGHALGHGHAYCSEAGARAPIMMQQTKGVGACEPHSWPLAHERT